MAVRFYLLFLLVSSIFIFPVPSHAEQEFGKIRIGYFPMYGFQEYDSNGKPKGYNVDYLNEVAYRTGWEYEFVRTDSWDDALDALEKGNVDLIGSAQITPERLDKFTYSSYNAGYTYGAILIPASNKNIAYEDFKYFSKLKIGCVKTFARKKEFFEYAAKNGLKPNIIYYDTTAKMRNAMRAGEINMMVASVMEIAPNEKVAGRFSHAPFFFISAKNRTPEIMNTLNEAMARTKLEKPHFDTQLFIKYYPSSDIIMFTRDEINYIRSAPEIRITHASNRKPISFIDENTGKITGISPDIMRLIEKDTGFRFKEVMIPTGADPIDILKENKADMAAGMLYTAVNLNNEEIDISNPYFEGTMALVGKKGSVFSPSLRLSVALPSGFQAGQKYLAAEYPLFDLISCNTGKECLDMVTKGEADVTLQNYYVLEEYLLQQRYKDLMAVPNTEFAERLSFGMLSGSNPILLSVMNKAISHISRDVKNQIIVNHTFAKTYTPTLEDFILKYNIPIVVIATTVVLLIIAAMVIIRQRRKLFESIKDSERRLQSITNNINGGVLTITPDNTLNILYANDGFMNLIGATDRNLLHETGLSGLLAGDNNLYNIFREKFSSARQISVELSIQHADGHYIPTLLRGTLSKDDKGHPLVYCVIVDINEQKSALDALKAAKERADLLIELSDSIFFDVSVLDYSVHTSPMFARKFGWDLPNGPLFAHTFEKRIHPEDGKTELVSREIEQQKRNSLFDMRVQKSDGVYIWCRFTLGYFYENGKITRVVGKIEDIDSDIQRRQYLEAISSKDTLTKLLNREAFQLSVEEFLEKSAKSGRGCGTLYFVDIDNFKSVNDTLGHSAGDNALIETAEMLRRIFRTEDILGRFGGDEFFVFAPSMKSDIATIKAAQLCNEGQKTYSDEAGNEAVVSISVGIARFPEDGRGLGELLQKADTALYNSKFDGKNRFTFFSTI